MQAKLIGEIYALSGADLYGVYCPVGVTRGYLDALTIKRNILNG